MNNHAETMRSKAKWSLVTGGLPKYRNGKKARIPSIGHTKNPAILSVYTLLCPRTGTLRDLGNTPSPWLLRDTNQVARSLTSRSLLSTASPTVAVTASTIPSAAA